MKRIGWLILLISLGLNVGLGYRMLNHRGSQPEDWFGSRGADFRGEGLRDEGAQGRWWRQGKARGEGRSGGRFSGHRRSDFFRPAPGDSGAWREVMEQRLERISRRLDLDPVQMESFRNTHRQAASRFRGQRLRVEKAESRLFELAARSPVEADSIRWSVRDLGRRKAQLDSLVTEAMLQELDSLNPEQRERYLRILPWSRARGGETGHPGRRQHSQANPPPDVPGE